LIRGDLLNQKRTGGFDRNVAFLDNPSTPIFFGLIGRHKSILYIS